MPVRLSTTISKISLIRNSTNQMLVKEFCDFMKSNDCSEKHINKNLKAIMNFDGTLDAKSCFLEIQRLDQKLIFLERKIIRVEEDPHVHIDWTMDHHVESLFEPFRIFLNGCITYTKTK